jgi:Na+-transporting NADH:ubiquinone oxidoreductase subunit F
MLEIVLGVASFTGIIFCMTLIILGVRARLVATGDVTITVNETRKVTGRVGEKLIRALEEADLRIPSACGGRGTCGQCRVTVLEGGGAALPTEEAVITRHAVLRGDRLACQVTIKRDMEIRVPEELLGARQWTCRVRSNANVATLLKEMVLELPPGEALEFRAGCYVLIHCPPYRAAFVDFDISAGFRQTWERLGLQHYRVENTKETTRAYSMANYPGEDGNIIRLIVRIAIPPPGAPAGVPPGIVSSYLFGRKPGDEVVSSGPFGHFFATDSNCEMVFVGGGAGMAPMRAHILDQLLQLKSNRTISFWYGARNLRELFYREDFDNLQEEHDNFRWVAALSEPEPGDDWEGPTGFIHEVLLDRYLKDHPAPEDCEYYLCGPPMMVKAVLAMLDNLGVDPGNIFYDDFGG